MYRGEWFNSITHLIGSILAIAGTCVLIGVSLRSGDPKKVAALALYGAMLIVLYLSSTIYHSIRGPSKRLFRVFDRCAIYLLIAGTYTPFTLLTLPGAWGWSIFLLIWALAVAGIVKDVLYPGRFRVASTILYLMMGWLVVVAIDPLRFALPHPGLMWLAAGGVAYTGGIIFFALSARNVPHSHGMWHVCVMAGSICHYIAVIRYVV